MQTIPTAHVQWLPSRASADRLGERAMCALEGSDAALEPAAARPRSRSLASLLHLR